MPIEIKELVIRTVVEGAGARRRAADEDPAAQDEPEEAPAAAAEPAAGTEDLVQECVRQVLRILEKQKER